MRLRTPITAAAALATAVIVASGCGGSDDRSAGIAAVPKGTVRSPLPEAVTAGQSKPADRSAGARVPQVRRLSALGRTGRQKVAAIDVRPAPQRLAATRENVVPPDGSEADYDQLVRAVIPLINTFWKKETTKLAPAARYEPPGHLVSYAGDDNPGCAGETSAAASHNAYYCASVVPYDQCTTPARNHGYCSGEDILAWDKPGLMLPFYREIGDLATALVLAHEWGHLIQARVLPQFNYKTTIRIELQADCYAGAWALEMKRQGRVDIGAFNQTLDLFETIGGPGAAWLDPDSHGNKFQRIRSFTQGFENDAQGCVGARFDSMLQRVGLGNEG